jgi:hypothetical protein
MGDDLDAMADAMALNKKLAARLIVRKEELEAEIAKGGAGEALAAELATTEQELAAAKKEMAELRKLAQERGEAPMKAFQREAALDAEVSGATAVKKPTREEADELARQEFEALRAQAKK